MYRTIAQIQEERVVAVLRASSSKELLETAVALSEGGLRCLEFTMTTPGALEALKIAVQEIGDSVLLGAGTVLDSETARAALLAGARFIVSPVISPDVIAIGKRYGTPVMPGALTPSEVLTAWEAGADLVKIFPAGRMGPDYLKDLHGPFPYIPFLPTGGITLENAVDYLRAGAVAVGMGGNLTRRGEGETYADLTIRARLLTERIRSLQL